MELVRQLSRHVGSVSTTRPHTSDRTKDAIKRVRWVVLLHRSYDIDISENFTLLSLRNTG